MSLRISELSVSPNNLATKANGFTNVLENTALKTRRGGVATGNVKTGVRPSDVITTGGVLTLQNGHGAGAPMISFTIADGSTLSSIIQDINTANVGFFATIKSVNGTPQFSIASTRRQDLTISGTAISAGTFDTQTGISASTYPAS